MHIEGSGRETYLYLNGVSTPRRLRLDENVHLLPAECEPDSDLIVSIFKKKIDVGVAAIFLGHVASQLHVTASSPKELASRAWNSLWDAILLSALFHCEAICNFQSDTPAEKLTDSSTVRVTNYHLRGLSTDKPHMLSASEAEWIEKHFNDAQDLLSKPAFQNAVHCLASYRWHTIPRARLALLWAGIEGLFQVESELVFRVSLYAAHFLEPIDPKARKQLFKDVRGLYKLRSQAVHGAKIEGKAGDCVKKSAALLQRLIQRCVINNSLPKVEELVP